ncbi:hypothetical protein RCL1_004798 [Eukaryota sp. TZLM3-RCL]
MEKEAKEIINQSNQSIIYDGQNFENLEVFGQYLDSCRLEHDNLRKKLSKLQDELSNQSRSISDLIFELPSNCRVDSSEVKGTVAKLFDIKDPTFLSALEVAAGGALSAVVVSNDQVASELLKSGLQQRVTFLPINKVAGPIISEEERSRVRSISEGRAHFAIDLVEFPPFLTSVMQHVFKKTVICLDKAHARQIAYNSPKLPTVTIEGDFYDPAGTITGGSSIKKAGILKKFAQVKQLERELNSLSLSYQQKSEQLRGLALILDEREKMVKVIAQKEGEISRQRSLMVNHDIVKKANSVEVLSKSVSEISDQISNLNIQFIADKERLLHLEKVVNEGQSEIRELKSKVVSSQNSLSEANLKLERLESEKRTLTVEIETLQSRIAANQSNLINLKSELSSLQSEVDSTPNSTKLRTRT